MRDDPRGQLQAILLNRIVNAIEATDDGMRTRAAPEVGRGGALHGDGYGTKNRSEKMDHVFDALVTTKTRGTGSGSAICGMSKRLGGSCPHRPADKPGPEFEASLLLNGPTNFAPKW